MRLRPVQPLLITLTSEVGTANHPFAPAEDKNYHVLGGRVQYKHKNLLLEVSSKGNYNVNSAALSSYSSHSRAYSASGSWTPNERLMFDVSYTKLHLDTLGGIFYFSPGLIQTDHSYYLSNIHAANVGVRLALIKRAEIYLGYSRVQDTGGSQQMQYASTPEILAAQTYPLTYQSPLARLSVPITKKLRWNLAYQYYGFHEDFSSRDGYRANTGYSSLQWAF